MSGAHFDHLRHVTLVGLTEEGFLFHSKLKLFLDVHRNHRTKSVDNLESKTYHFLQIVTCYKLNINNKHLNAIMYRKIRAIEVH